MLILGLDPSTVATGWALLSVDGGDESVIASGVFQPVCEGSFEELLLSAFHWTREVIEVHGPDVLAIETPFFKLNARTLATLAGLGAAFRLAAALDGLDVAPITPSARCTAVGCAGNASKRQVQYAVNAVYGLDLVDTDESDAVAIAAAGALRWRMEQMGG